MKTAWSKGEPTRPENATVWCVPLVARGCQAAQTAWKQPRNPHSSVKCQSKYISEYVCIICTEGRPEQGRKR